MSNKKLFMSVTATAAIASALFYAEEANASSYTVKQGDTLWAISQKYNTSVAQLKSLNGLSGDLIRINQVLKVDGGSTTNNSKPSTSSNSATSSSSTYTVVKGDNLSKIAANHGITVKNLMDWNNLNSTLIFPGDRLTVSKSSGSNSNSSNNSSNNSNSNNSSSSNSSTSSSSTYTVKSGDNLSKIAAAHGISLNNLKQWNSLTSHLIYPGDRLVVSQNGSATNNNSNQNSSSSNASSNATSNNVIDIAKSAMGTKYTWGGTSLKTGFDCSGFIHWAFNESGKKMGRFSTDGYYNRSYIVNTPEVGDLVFFENTYRKGISHMGIYLGNGQFIHAGSSTGVAIANVNSSYWSKHFHSYKRFY